MSLQKTVGIKVTTKSDTAGLDKMANSADKAADKVNKLGRQAKGVKGLRDDFRGMATNAAASIGILGGGLVVMDKVIMGQMKYGALLRNAPFDIKAASDATKGYISQTKLLESANAANRAGFIKSSKTFAQFAEDVQRLAMSTGEDTSTALDVLTRALAKNESELLDNYNINLKVSDAKKELAAQFAAEGRAMTAADEQMAFATIGMQRIREAASKANVDLDEHTAAWLKMKAALTDIPALMHNTSQAIYEVMAAEDEARRKGSILRGDADLLGDNRRGTGVKGGFGKLRERVIKDTLAANDPSTQHLLEWKERMDAYGRFIGETGSKAMIDAAEDAAIQMVIQKRKRGGKAKFQWGKALRDQIMLEASADMMSREGSDTRDYARELTLSRGVGPMREANKRAAAEAAEIELKRSEAVLEARRMSLEIAEERGLTPQALADAEEAAVQQQLDAKERYIQATMTGAERLMAMEELHAERRKAIHQRDLAHIRAEMKAKEVQKARMVAMGDAIVDVHAGVAAAAIQGAFAEGVSVKAAVAGFAKARAVEMTILAATESIKAIAAAASFNFPAAQAHGVAAAMAGAEAVSLFALAGAAGAFSGGGSGRGRGTRGPSYGGGGGGRGPSPQQSSNQGAPPISRDGPAPPQAPQQGGGAPVHITVHSMFPPNAEELMINFRKAMAKSERDNPL